MAAPTRSDATHAPRGTGGALDPGLVALRRTWMALAAASVLVRVLLDRDGIRLEAWGTLAQWGSGEVLVGANDGLGAAAPQLPVVPLLVSALRWVTGDVLTTAVLLSYVAGAAAALAGWTWLGELGVSEGVRRSAVSLVLMAPTSWVLYGVVGPEAVAVALVAAVLVALARGNLPVAAVLGGVAMATHATAWCVLAGLVWAAWSEAPDRRRAIVRVGAVGIGLPAAVVAVVAVVGEVAHGDPWAIWRVAFAGTGNGPLAPSTWVRIGVVWAEAPWTWTLNRTLQVAATYLTAGLGVVLWRRGRPREALVVLATVVLTLQSVADPAGFGRGLVVAVPAVLPVAEWLGAGTSVRRRVLLGASTALMALAYGSYLRSTGYPYW